MYSAGFILNSWQVVKPTFLLYVPPYHYAVLTVVYLGPKMYIFFFFEKFQTTKSKILQKMATYFVYDFSLFLFSPLH